MDNPPEGHPAHAIADMGAKLTALRLAQQRHNAENTYTGGTLPAIHHSAAAAIDSES